MATARPPTEAIQTAEHAFYRVVDGVCTDLCILREHWPSRTAPDVMAAEARPDLAIVDLMMPGLDGMEVCRRLRSGGERVPVLMLTARDEEPDRVSGLELGADDYLTKPFSPRELVARVKAVLRRAEPWLEEARLSARDVVVLRDAREVRVAGEPVSLTSREFDLLSILLGNPDRVLTRELLLDRVWGLAFPGGTRTVDMHVATLRRKLGRPELVQTVRGVGYKLGRG